jgi:hypothetical protein
MDKSSTGIPALDDFIDQHKWADASMFKIDYNSDTDFVVHKKNAGAWDGFINYFTVAEHDHEIDNADAFRKDNGDPEYDKHIVLDGWTYNIDPNKVTVGKHNYLNDKNELDYGMKDEDPKEDTFDDSFIKDIKESLRLGIITLDEADLLIEEELRIREGLFGMGNDKAVGDDELNQMIAQLKPLVKDDKQIIQQFQTVIPALSQATDKADGADQQQAANAAPGDAGTVAPNAAAQGAPGAPAAAASAPRAAADAAPDPATPQGQKQIAGNKQKISKLLTGLNIQDPDGSLEKKLLKVSGDVIGKISTAVDQLKGGATPATPAKASMADQMSQMHQSSSRIKTKSSITEARGLDILNRAIAIVMLESQLVEVGGAQLATQTSGGGNAFTNFANQAAGATGLAPKLSPTSGLLDPDQLNKFVTAPSTVPNMFMKGNPQGYSVSPDGMLMRGQYQVGQLNAQQLNGLRGNLEQQGMPADSTTINPNSFKALGVEDSTGPNIGGDPNAGSQMVGELDGVPGRADGIPATPAATPAPAAAAEPQSDGGSIEHVGSTSIMKDPSGNIISVQDINGNDITKQYKDEQAMTADTSHEPVDTGAADSTPVAADSTPVAAANGSTTAAAGDDIPQDHTGSMDAAGQVTSSYGDSGANHEDLMALAGDAGKQVMSVVGPLAAHLIPGIGTALALAGLAWKGYQMGKQMGWWGKGKAAQAPQAQPQMTPQQEQQLSQASSAVMASYLHAILTSATAEDSKSKTGFMGMQNARAQMINRSLKANPLVYQIGQDPKQRFIKQFADVGVAVKALVAGQVTRVGMQSQKIAQAA